MNTEPDAFGSEIRVRTSHCYSADHIVLKSRNRRIPKGQTDDFSRHCGQKSPQLAGAGEVGPGAVGGEYEGGTVNLIGSGLTPTVSKHDEPGPIRGRRIRGKQPAGQPGGICSPRAAQGTGDSGGTCARPGSAHKPGLKEPEPENWNKPSFVHAFDKIQRAPRVEKRQNAAIDLPWRHLLR